MLVFLGLSETMNNTKFFTMNNTRFFFADIVTDNWPTQASFQEQLQNNYKPVLDQVLPIFIAIWAVSLLIRGLLRG